MRINLDFCFNHSRKVCNEVGFVKKNEASCRCHRERDVVSASPFKGGRKTNSEPWLRFLFRFTEVYRVLPGFTSSLFFFFYRVRVYCRAAQVLPVGLQRRHPSIQKKRIKESERERENGGIDRRY